jgi:hypothetical protein
MSKYEPKDSPTEASGLLHHEADREADVRLEAGGPREELVNEAASESHHGVIREKAVSLGREEEARLVLESTTITPFVAWAMTILFLLTICSVPILQHVLEIRKNLAERRIEVANGEAPQTPILPKSYDAIQELPSLEQLRNVDSFKAAWELIPSASRFQEHEEALQDDSYIVQWTLPKLQKVLVQMGVGNEQAYCGEVVNGHRWLHYRPDVDYVTSTGFLNPTLLLMRKRSGDMDTEMVQPDPVRAIVDFKQQLAKRGIELIVMPTPLKTMMHPEALSTRYKFAQTTLQNPSYSQFQRALQEKGVKVFDCSDRLAQEMKRTQKAQYLETDTHWTPQAMELVAQGLSAFIEREVTFQQEADYQCQRHSVAVSNAGDITDMLRLPEEQKLFLPQKVTVKQVINPDGELWYPSRGAEILLLGDSFSNIYSLEGMKWGESAGFGEQLSFFLKRPIDSITNNAGGSHVTRERLVKEMARGKNRLRGKRVVIWQFAMRDLLIGNWKLLELPSGKSPS